MANRKANDDLAALQQAVERQSGSAQALADEIRRSITPDTSPDNRRKMNGWADAIQKLSVDLTFAVNDSSYEELRWYSSLVGRWADGMSRVAVGGVISGLVLSGATLVHAEAVTKEEPIIVQFSVALEENNEPETDEPETDEPETDEPETDETERALAEAEATAAAALAKAQQKTKAAERTAEREAEARLQVSNAKEALAAAMRRDEKGAAIVKAKGVAIDIGSLNWVTKMAKERAEAEEALATAEAQMARAVAAAAKAVAEQKAAELALGVATQEKRALSNAANGDI